MKKYVADCTYELIPIEQASASWIARNKAVYLAADVEQVLQDMLKENNLDDRSILPWIRGYETACKRLLASLGGKS